MEHIDGVCVLEAMETEAGPQSTLNARLQGAEALMSKNWGPSGVPGQGEE